VAVIERRGKFLVAEPFFAPGPRMAVSRDSRYDVGDLVVVSVGGAAGADGGRARGHGRSGRGGGGGRARVLRRLGRPDVARDVIEALMVDRGLSRGFDPAVARAARLASESPVQVAGPGTGPGSGRAARRDLRSLPTFTIDPATARDFDDAVSAESLSEKGEDGWRVWVHIADVGAYVPPRGPVDREAFRRGTSVYVPGAVEPMLPTELSNGACSLAAGVDRYAVSVEMVIRGDRAVSASFSRSIIRSDKRLAYEEVDEIFAGNVRATDAWGEALGIARAAARALGERRAASGAIELGSTEPEFSFDREGHVVAVAPVAQTESHRLIEFLMIAANEQVARFLEARRVPALYRVHERPEARSVERMIDQLASLGVPTPPVPGGTMTAQQAADVAGEASQMVGAWVQAQGGRGARALNRIVLRSLKQAYYDNRNLGHAGLQLHSYCHFTSPIRRYPDLICHRALLSAVTGDEPVPESSWVASTGAICSAREREAMTIERDADDVARCFLLERELFEAEAGFQRIFLGEIVGVIGAGAFVAFGGASDGRPGGEFEGLLPVRRMRDDWWELNEWETALVGTRHGRALRLGDTVAVRVGGIEARRGRVDLLPVDDDD
jgi:ribonuclease R